MLFQDFFASHVKLKSFTRISYLNSRNSKPLLQPLLFMFCEAQARCSAPMRHGVAGRSSPSASIFVSRTSWLPELPNPRTLLFYYVHVCLIYLRTHPLSNGAMLYSRLYVSSCEHYESNSIAPIQSTRDMKLQSSTQCQWFRHSLELLSPIHSSSFRRTKA